MDRRPWRFGDFEVDAVAPELRSHGRTIRLQALPHKLLLYLLERCGEVVTREELRLRLWPDGHFVDFEHGLNTAIKKLRAALSESVTGPGYIETVPRIGYRFTGEATRTVDGAIRAATPSDVGHSAARPAEPRRVRIRWSVAAVIVGIGVLLAAGAAALSYSRFPAASVSIVVLPLKNLSAGPETDYFSEGITEALITDLGRLGIARVISRTSAAQAQRTDKKLSDIASDLGVQYVVEGGAARSPERVRVTVRLIDGRTDRQVWADTFESDARDVITMQDDIARAIASRVTTTLAARIGLHLLRTRTVSPEAYDMYLMGRYELGDWRKAHLEKAVAYFEEAVRRDHGYAPAWAGVAQAYAHLGGFRFMPMDEARANTERAARQAIALDANLSDAHVALGEVFEQQFSFPAAEREFRRAVALNPNDPIAHQRLGYALDRSGRLDEAVDEMRAGCERDPLSQSMLNALGAAYYRGRRYDEAVAIIRTIPDGDANTERRHRRLAVIHEERRMERDARAEWIRTVKPSALAADVVRRACASATYAECREAALLCDIEELRVRGDRPLAIAEDFALLGKSDESIACLREAFAVRRAEAFYFKDPEWDKIRSDPRFSELVGIYQQGLAVR